MTLDSLEKCEDVELKAIIGRCDELLKKHDAERKEKALAEARATLAAAGLSLKDLNGKGHKANKGPTYHGGHSYEHPANKALVWNARGKKPHWVIELESTGGKLIESQPANDNVPVSAKKTG